MLMKDDLLDLYSRMVLLRKFEEEVQKLYKKGEIPGFIHLYIGQEATGVGVCSHLRKDDWITSTHRGHGHALAKGVPPDQVLAELYGKATGCCGGRGGSMHLYAPEHGLFGTTGFVAGGIPSTTGLAMSAAVRGTDQVAVSFFGDGAVSHGSFHEAVNFAAARDLPVIFVCENNLYATATPLSASTKNTDISSKAHAYGIPGVTVDGNDVLAVWHVVKEAVQQARSGGGPTLIESRTYRLVGHHEGDPHVGTYRTQDELDEWRTRCPIKQFTSHVTDEGIASLEELKKIDETVEEVMRQAVEFARSAPAPDPSSAVLNVWAEPVNPTLPSPPSAASEARVQGWLEAVRDGIAEEMRRDSNVVYLGEGIGERGGAFAHTKELWSEFGDHRLVDTPICESTITGAGIGLSATGCRAVVDLMFTDFVFDAASQIIHQAAKLRYMSNGQIGVPMIVRSMNGTIKSAGPHHSGNYYPVFAHCPGLIVVVPSTPADAKGLFKTALQASDPVLIFEHKSLLATKGPVPACEHYVPFGQAAVRREGENITLVACGLMIHKCIEAAKQLGSEEISCEVIDLRTIVPLDVQTVARSVLKTGHLLIVDESYSMCGIGAEITACMMEEVFDHLEAPIGRLHIDPVPSPFSPSLENAVLPTPGKIVTAVRSILGGHAPRQVRPAGVKSGYSEGGPGDTGPGYSDRVETLEMNDEPGAGITQTSYLPDAKCIPLKMPNQDLTVTEATLLRWLKKTGDPIEVGEVVIEVETDKAIVEIEAEVDGILGEVLVQPGTTVSVDQPFGMIHTD
jgi:2-oxoisovalerate dehydrogenase E1 component